MRYNFICFNKFLPVREVTVTGNNIDEAVNNFNDADQLVMYIDYTGFVKEFTVGNNKIWHYGDGDHSTECIIVSEDSGYFNLHLYRDKTPIDKGTNYYLIYKNLISSLK